MWRLLNRLFGWHYVHAANQWDAITRRVRITRKGERYVDYGAGMLIFIDRTDHGWTITELTTA